MNELSIPSLIEETKSLLGSVRQSLVKVAANLHFLRETGEQEKFGEWAEEEFGLSRSMTSKLLTIYSAWILRAGLSQEQIEGIDYEKLYGYVPLLEGKTKEQALAEVQSWSRGDIKAEKNEKAPCFHPIVQPICTECWNVVEGQRVTSMGNFQA